MVIAQQPNMPITQVENTTNISTGEADVANAQRRSGSRGTRSRNGGSASWRKPKLTTRKHKPIWPATRLLIAKEEVSQQEYDQVVRRRQGAGGCGAASQARLQSAAQIVDQKRAQLARSGEPVAQYRRNAPRAACDSARDRAIGAGQRAKLRKRKWNKRN